MIHALIDTVDHRQITGFEIGTRAQFDKRHGGDPLWVFVDSYQVKYRANIKNFLRNYVQYKVDLYGNLHLSFEPPVVIPDEEPPQIPGYTVLKGEDGRYLKGEDGNFIYGYEVGYNPPPFGTFYLLDEDNVFLTDGDGVTFLIEDILPPSLEGILILDSNGSFIIDTTFEFIVDDPTL